MDIIGKWKVKELGLMQLGDMSMKMFTPAEIENLEDNEDYLQFVSSIYNFSNDGKLDILLEVPKELLEKAKKEGLEVKDNVVIIESILPMMPCVSRARPARASTICWSPLSF